MRWLDLEFCLDGLVPARGWFENGLKERALLRILDRNLTAMLERFHLQRMTCVVHIEDKQSKTSEVRWKRNCEGPWWN